MTRKQASDYPQELLDIYDDYVHSRISRRDFFDRASKFAIAGMTAAALLDSLSPNYALAEQVGKDDPGIRASYAEYDSPLGNGDGKGRMKGYLVLPAPAADADHDNAKSIAPKYPAVLVIHENRGLNPYIEDVARRVGKAGYIAFAPDALAPLGGYPGDEDKGRALFQQLDGKKTIEDFIAAVDWLRGRGDFNGKLGAVGFCFGGGMVNTLCVRIPDKIQAGVPFYGGQPSAEDAAKIKAPLLLHYAEKDQRITGGWPAFETALKAAGKTEGKDFQAFIYPGVNHGFHNDTTPRYDEAAAKLAWRRTMDFFDEKLKGAKPAQ